MSDKYSKWLAIMEEGIAKTQERLSNEKDRRSQDCLKAVLQGLRDAILQVEEQ